MIIYQSICNVLPVLMTSSTTTFYSFQYWCLHVNYVENVDFLTYSCLLHVYHTLHCNFFANIIWFNFCCFLQNHGLCLFGRPCFTPEAPMKACWLDFTAPILSSRRFQMISTKHPLIPTNAAYAKLCKLFGKPVWIL